MPPAEKSRHRSGYSTEDTLQVRSACLTVAVTLGAYLDQVCIVGGLVPSLLIDLQQDSAVVEDRADPHPGTNDLDIGLALALLDDKRYAEISQRLRQEGFRPDTNAKDNLSLIWSGVCQGLSSFDRVVVGAVGALSGRHGRKVQSHRLRGQTDMRGLDLKTRYSSRLAV